MHKVYVYGTLRRGQAETFQVPGVMYDLGWFPGVVREAPNGETFTCEVVEVDDHRLARFDHYEGYNEESPESSLYIRERYNDGWIYVYNRGLSGSERVESGDWLNYTGQKEGTATHV